MQKIKNENDFRDWIRGTKKRMGAYAGWSNRIEPTMGMAPGISDLIMMTDIGLVPTELKIAKIEDGILWSREIRGSQISWHFDFYQQNCGRQPLTVFLFGVQVNDDWRIFACEGDQVMDWEDGFPIKETTELDAQSFTNSFEDFCADALG